MLGPPLTFALSQDQTLHRKFEPALRWLIAAPPGGRQRPTWNGFYQYLSTEKTHLSSLNGLLSSFQRPIPTGSVLLVGLEGLGPSRDAAYTGSVFSRQHRSKKNPFGVRPHLQPPVLSRLFHRLLDEDPANTAPTPIRIVTDKAQSGKLSVTRPRCSRKPL